MKRNLAALAALLLCVSTYGQTAASSSTPTPAPNENTLESARRELKELPAAERSHDQLGKHSTLGTAALPTLTLPGDASNTAARPGPNNPPSATWLQDALNQTDVEAATHRRATDPALARDRARPGVFKPAETPNLLDQYLEQWVSPRDLELLRAGQDAKAPSNPSQPVAAKPWDPLPASSATATPGRTFDASNTGAGQSLAPIMPVTRNPYIEDPEPTAPLQNSLLPQLLTGQPQGDRSRVPAPLASTPSAEPLGSRQAAPLKPAAKPAEAPFRPPTAPLVDDRKYFPQLRRF